MKLAIFLFFSLIYFEIMGQITYPYHCTSEDREKLCNNTEKSPFCGWYNASTRCYDYPCAGHFSSVCEACINKWVDRVTQGACPSKVGENA